MCSYSTEGDNYKNDDSAIDVIVVSVWSHDIILQDFSAATVEHMVKPSYEAIQLHSQWLGWDREAIKDGWIANWKLCSNHGDYKYCFIGIIWHIDFTRVRSKKRICQNLSIYKAEKLSVLLKFDGVQQFFQLKDLKDTWKWFLPQTKRSSSKNKVAFIRSFQLLLLALYGLLNAKG